MADELVAIADAVVVELNEAVRWTLPFIASRLYLPETELDQFAAGAMHVTVLARGRARETASRGRTQASYAVPILFQQKLAANTDDAIALSVEAQFDPLMNLVQEVADWFDKVGATPLATYPAAVLTGIVNDPAYDQGSMEENGLFASVLVLGFRTWRDKRA